MVKVNTQGLKIQELEIKDKEIKNYFLKFKDSEDTLVEEIKRMLKIGIMVVTDERLMTLINQLETELDAKFANLKMLLREREVKGAVEKGREFEDLFSSVINEYSRIFNDTVIATGNTIGLIPQSKKGDYVITLSPEDTMGVDAKIVVEIKTKTMGIGGKKGILEELKEAKQNRGAFESIAVFTKDGIPEECGRFRYYPEYGVVCAIDEETMDTLPFEIAYKFVRTRTLLNLFKETKRAIDVSKISNLLDVAEKQLNTITQMKSTVTKTSTSILSINDQLETLKVNLMKVFEQIDAELKKG